MKTTHVKAHSRHQNLADPFIKHEEAKEKKERAERKFGGVVVAKKTFTDAQGRTHDAYILRKKGIYAASDTITSPDGTVTHKNTLLPKVKNDTKATAGLFTYVAAEKATSEAVVLGKKAGAFAKKEAKEAGKLALKGAKATGAFAKKEFGVFKKFLARKKEEREEQKRIKEETGQKLETY